MKSWKPESACPEGDFIPFRSTVCLSRNIERRKARAKLRRGAPRISKSTVTSVATVRPIRFLDINFDRSRGKVESSHGGHGGHGGDEMIKKSPRFDMRESGRVNFSQHG